MSDRNIYHRFHPPGRRILLGATAAALRQIKKEDRLTWSDLGDVLAKCEDSVRSYASGRGEMGMVSFLRGTERWDGRFAGRALALVGMQVSPIAATDPLSPGNALRALAELMAAKAAALEDGVVTDDEVEAMWPLIEAVGRHIDRLRARHAETLRLPTYDTS